MTLQEMKSKAEALSNDDLIEIMLPYMFLPHDEADLFFEYLHQAKCNQIIALYKIEGLFYVSAKGTKENDNKTTHEFTTKASDVLRSGGWKKYIESKAQKDKRLEILENSMIGINRFQRWILIITVIVSALNFGVACLSHRATLLEIQRCQSRDIEDQKEKTEQKSVEQQQLNLLYNYIDYCKNRDMLLENTKKK